MTIDANARIGRHELSRPSFRETPIDSGSIFDMVGGARLALDAGFAIPEVEYMLDLADGSISRMLSPERREAVLVKPARQRAA